MNYVGSNLNYAMSAPAFGNNLNYNGPFTNNIPNNSIFFGANNIDEENSKKNSKLGSITLATLLVSGIGFAAYAMYGKNNGGNWASKFYDNAKDYIMDKMQALGLIKNASKQVPDQIDSKSLVKRANELAQLQIQNNDTDYSNEIQELRSNISQFYQSKIAKFDKKQLATKDLLEFLSNSTDDFQSAIKGTYLEKAISSIDGKNIKFNEEFLKQNSQGRRLLNNLESKKGKSSFTIDDMKKFFNSEIDHYVTKKENLVANNAYVLNSNSLQDLADLANYKKISFETKLAENISKIKTQDDLQNLLQKADKLSENNVLEFDIRSLKEKILSEFKLSKKNIELTNDFLNNLKAENLIVTKGKSWTVSLPQVCYS